jgi:hypothetical protein
MLFSSLTLRRLLVLPRKFSTTLTHYNVLNDIKSYLRDSGNLKPLSFLDLVSMFYHASTKKIILNKYEIDNFTYALNISTGIVKQKNIGTLIYGLSNINEDNITNDLLEAILLKVIQCDEYFSYKSVGMTLYGMKNLNSSNHIVRKLLYELNNKYFIIDKYEIITPQVISTSLYGLQKCNSDFDEVRMTLQYIYNIGITCRKSFTAQEISMSLYGIQNMSNKYIEVQQILELLHIQLDKSFDIMSAQNICNSLYGLQNCFLEYPNANEILNQLLIKVKRDNNKKLIITGKFIASSLYGMRNMSSSYEVVRKWLTFLLENTQEYEKWSKIRIIMHNHELNSAFYGLQNMNNDNEEVNNMLIYLHHKLCDSKIPLNNPVIVSILNGTRSMELLPSTTSTTTCTTTTTIDNNGLIMDRYTVLNELYTTLLSHIKSISKYDNNIYNNTTTNNNNYNQYIDINLNNKIKLRAFEISTILKAISNKSLKVDNIKHIITWLRKQIDLCNEQYTDISIMNCFIGLSNLTYNTDIIGINIILNVMNSLCYKLYHTNYYNIDIYGIIILLENYNKIINNITKIISTNTTTNTTNTKTNKDDDSNTSNIDKLNEKINKISKYFHISILDKLKYNLLSTDNKINNSNNSNDTAITNNNNTSSSNASKWNEKDIKNIIYIISMLDMNHRECKLFIKNIGDKMEESNCVISNDTSNYINKNLQHWDTKYSSQLKYIQRKLKIS